MKSIASLTAIFFIPFFQDAMAAEAHLKKSLGQSQIDTPACLEAIKSCNDAYDDAAHAFKVLSPDVDKKQDYCVSACKKAMIECKTNRSVEKGQPETPFHISKSYRLHCTNNKNKIKNK